MQPIAFVLQIAFCVLITDFLSGLLHWLEDSYGKPNWPILGRFIIQPNIRHHHSPMAFTQNSWLRSASVLLFIGAALLIAASLLGILSWRVWAIVMIGVNANEFHKWAHQPTDKNSRIVNLLQRLFILQTPTHHEIHHRRSKDSHYCVVTNLLNPLLEKLRIWRRLESLIHVTLGVTKRPDPSVAITRAV